MARFLTHKELETICDQLLVMAGWERNYKNEYSGIEQFCPDRIYSKDNEWPLVFEIKPENASSMEIKTGIGQSAWFLPYRVKPYLILSENQWKVFVNVIKLLPWLGVFSYPDTTPQKIAQYNNFTIKQKSLRLDNEGFLPITITPTIRKTQATRKSLSSGNISQIITKARMLGFYTTVTIVDLLRKANPNETITPVAVGYSLKQLGYKKSRRGGKTGYIITKRLSLRVKE